MSITILINRLLNSTGKSHKTACSAKNLRLADQPFHNGVTRSSLASSKEIIDPAMFTRFNHDLEKYFALIQQLIDDLRVDLAQIEQNTSAKEWCHAMHKIKGTAMILGALELSDTAFMIEEKLQTQQQINIDESIAALYECISRLANHIYAMDLQ